MVSLTVLTIFFLSISGICLGSPHNGHNFPTVCCFGYISKKIPKKLLVQYEYTSQICSKPAVIFISKRGQRLCANPEENWVQDMMSYLNPKQESEEYEYFEMYPWEE
ncbi:C-C motif chemokine 4-like isoform X2 [Gracilinanus agilis]|uniref:C-C motif chemokine 4-like isoform X2 n=1 Tax=Gracilinanus agilis TaxID=191870 RepID=UPI001CFF2BBA|nr:C-C motif chemokine 4-like isoform X2 [Gracilinanus agilis]